MYWASQDHVIIVKQKTVEACKKLPRRSLSGVRWGKKLGRETPPHLRLSKAEKASLEATSLSRIITVSHVLSSFPRYVIYTYIKWTEVLLLLLPADSLRANSPGRSGGGAPRHQTERPGELARSLPDNKSAG